MGGDDEIVTWPETVFILGLFFLVAIFILAMIASWLEFRKTKLVAAQEEDLRQLVHRYEQLAEKTMDAQQRAAADLADLRSRTAAVEKILRTVE